MELSALEQKLGYVFKDQSLLAQALVHPSIAGDGRHESNNQRLEYLGDAVIELAVSQHLYKRCLLYTSGMRIAGKTGTAQTGNNVTEIGWYAGYIIEGGENYVVLVHTDGFKGETSDIKHRCV